MALKKVSFTEKQIWDYLMKTINNAYGVAGLLGNIKAESNLKPTNLQNTYERKFGLSDEDYTNQVDNGTYTNFIKDSAGYGLVQWTYWSRKQNLYNYCKGKGASIGCCETQLDFMIQELKGYGLLDYLQNAKSVREASDKILLKYEKPADQSETVQIKRASYGQDFYNKYANSNSSSTIINKGDGKMTNLELIEKLKQLVNVSTVYMYGAWGQPVTEAFIKQKANQYPSWYTEDRKNMLRKHIGKSFGFDCVNMIKSVLWGFNFDMNATNGGAKYGSNGVPDVNADGMIASHCTNVSTDFSNIKVGAIVWVQGHVGVYIGNKQVIECTPKWNNNCQISNLGNLGNNTGNSRTWSRWGLLKYITYVEEEKKEEVKPVTPQPTPQPTKPTTPTTNEVTYIVKKGDTLSKIAKQYGTTYQKIAKDNNIANPNIIITGQKLIIKTNKVTETKEETKQEVKQETYRTHTVVKGDTLWGISKKYLNNGARYNEIMRLNNLTSATIYSGMVLKIPN